MFSVGLPPDTVVQAVDLIDDLSGDLVEVLDIARLVDPSNDVIAGRFHAGEELQEPAHFNKRKMTFPSGEDLPACWLDPNYRSRG